MLPARCVQGPNTQMDCSGPAVFIHPGTIGRRQAAASVLACGRTTKYIIFAAGNGPAMMRSRRRDVFSFNIVASTKPCRFLPTTLVVLIWEMSPLPERQWMNRAKGTLTNALPVDISVDKWTTERDPVHTEIRIYALRPTRRDLGRRGCEWQPRERVLVWGKKRKDVRIGTAAPFDEKARDML